MDPFFQDIIKTRFALAHEEGESKVVPLAEAIRRNVEDGMSIHFLGLHYRSHAAIYELFRQFRNRRPNFTIMAGTLTRTDHDTISRRNDQEGRHGNSRRGLSDHGT
jgi:hypothetical protein